MPAPSIGVISVMTISVLIALIVLIIFGFVQAVITNLEEFVMITVVCVYAQRKNEWSSVNVVLAPNNPLRTSY
jgi:hypothetical protein